MEPKRPEDTPTSKVQHRGEPWIVRIFQYTLLLFPHGFTVSVRRVAEWVPTCSTEHEPSFFTHGKGNSTRKFITLRINGEGGRRISHCCLSAATRAWQGNAPSTWFSLHCCDPCPNKHSFWTTKKKGNCNSTFFLNYRHFAENETSWHWKWE